MTEIRSTPFTMQALHTNGTDFQALIEHSADLVTVLNSEWQILYQSPSAVRLLGSVQTPYAAIGRHGAEDRHPDDHHCLQRILDLPPGVTLSLPPYRLRTSTGRWVWLEGTAINMSGHAQVQGILIQARDVTVRVLSEQRTHAAARLSSALAAAYSTQEIIEVILTHGLDTMGAVAGGVILLDSDGAHLTVLGSRGYTENVERPWRRFSIEAPVPAAQAIREQTDLFLTREDWCQQFPHLQAIADPTTASSSVLTLSINQRTVGAITLSFSEDRAFSETDRQFLRSVAAKCGLALERGELTAQLQHQERLFRKLTERSGDLVTILAPDGTTQYVSPSIEHILGYSPRERLGKCAFDGIHPEDMDKVMDAYRCAGRSAHPILVTYRFQHKNGSWVWLESTGINATDDPDLQGLLINTRDVTTRVEAHEARHATERRLQLFGEQTDTLIRIFDPAGTCLFASPAADTMLGYSPQELMHFQKQELIHPDDLAAVEQAWATHTILPPYRKRRRDGTYVWVESSIRNVTDETGTLLEVHVATRNVTAHVEAEASLRQQVQRFQHLVNLTAEFATQEAATDHIQTALDRCLRLTPFTFGFFFPIREEKALPPLRAGVNPEGLLSSIAPPATPHHSSPISRALRQHQPVFAGPQDHIYGPDEPLPRPVWTSLAVLPIVTKCALRGFMAFGTSEPVYPDSDSRRLLIGVGEQVGRAIERHDHLSELKQSREETLRALGLALEYRDYETKGHTDRVVHLTERLGHVLGFTGDDLDALRWGAFLHDTGKVAIPDSILLKPGKLNAQEWDVIKRHPAIGYEMLKHIPSLPPATLEVVLHHQERWNGSGYPKGLAGPDIPLAARVFAVVDVFDALTSERPYKKAWSHEEAVRQLRLEAGVLLDARVVEAFIHLLSEDSRPQVAPDDAA